MLQLGVAYKVSSHLLFWVLTPWRLDLCPSHFSAAPVRGAPWPQLSGLAVSVADTSASTAASFPSPATSEQRKVCTGRGGEEKEDTGSLTRLQLQPQPWQKEVQHMAQDTGHYDWLKCAWEMRGTPREMRKTAGRILELRRM